MALTCISALRNRAAPWSADLDLGVGKEGVGRNRQVHRGRALADAAGGVVDRAVAGAEPAVVRRLDGRAARSRDGCRCRYRISHCALPGLTRAASACGSRKRTRRRRPRAALISFSRPVADEDRLAAPEHLDDLPFGDRREVEFDRSAGRDGRGVGSHLADERPEHAARRRRQRRPSRCKRKSRRVGSAVCIVVLPRVVILATCASPAPRSAGRSVVIDRFRLVPAHMRV